jgi:hypothetical protein
MIHIRIADKWYAIIEFDDYATIEAEAEEVFTNIKGFTLTADNFEEAVHVANMPDGDRNIVIAYFEATGVFNHEEALDAFVGTSYRNPADFAQCICEEVESEALEALPTYLRDCIKWSDVWDYYLRHDYFEYSGYYFRNV